MEMIFYSNQLFLIILLWIADLIPYSKYVGYSMCVRARACVRVCVCVCVCEVNLCKLVSLDLADVVLTACSRLQLV